MNLIPILAEHDAALRGYATRLDPDHGEDLYHDILLSVLRRGEALRNPLHYLKRSIKLAVWKAAARRWRQLELTQDWFDGTRPPAFACLTLGRQRQTACRRGHPFQPSTVCYIQGQRTCLICRRESGRVRNQRYRQRQRAALPPTTVQMQ